LLLSRAAEDYRRKHPDSVVATSVRSSAAQHTGATDSDSSVSNIAANNTTAASVDAHSARTAAASIDSSTITNSVSSGTDVAAITTATAVSKERQKRIAPVSAVSMDYDKQPAATAATTTAANNDICKECNDSTAVSAHEPSTSSSTGSSISPTSNAAQASTQTDAAQQADAAVDGIGELLSTVTVQQQPCKVRKAKQPCANCKQPTGRLCRRCAAVYYCSVECQRVCFSDAHHRAQCEAMAAAAQMS
jgi:hypothetical protein